MGKLPTYGMAGIGIAAAIGFVFALSIFSANSGIINTNLEQSRQEKTNEPTGQKAGNNGAAPLFGKSTDQSAYFRGDIAAQSGIELELYWNPDTPGDYTILLSSNTPLDLASPEPTKPVAIIPVKVVAAL